jgi:hypothetical protein
MQPRCLYKIFTEIDTVMELMQGCVSLKEALDTFALHVMDSNTQGNKGFGQIVYIWSVDANELVSAYDPNGVSMKPSKKRTCKL